MSRFQLAVRAQQTKLTIVGKNEIYNRKNLVGRFLVRKIWVPNPLPPPSSSKDTVRHVFVGSEMYSHTTVRRLCLGTQEKRGWCMWERLGSAHRSIGAVEWKELIGLDAIGGHG